MKVQVLKYTKKFFLHFSKTKLRRGSSHKTILFFPCRISTGRNFAPRAKNQSFSENMTENLMSIIRFF